MLKSTSRTAIAAMLLLLVIVSAGQLLQNNATAASPQFGIMPNSDDMRRTPPAKIAAMMKEIGCKNVAISCQPDELDTMIKAYRDAGIRVGAVYVGWSTDGESASFNIPIEKVFDHLRDTGAVVMIHTSVARGKKVGEKKIAELLLPLAKQAQKAGVTVAIYPHVGNLLPTIEIATSIADTVDHPSLGVCFNLCHFLKQHDAADIPAKVRAARHRLKLVTINGAAVGDTRAMSWDKLIQQLNQGQFDLTKLLELVCGELKFDGPIFVQCYNLKAPSRTIMQDTFDRWQELKKHCRKSSSVAK